MSKEIHCVEDMNIGHKYMWNYGQEHFPDVAKEDFVGICTSIEEGRCGLEATVDFEKAIVNVVFITDSLMDDTLVEID